MSIELKGVQLPALLALPDCPDQQSLQEAVHALLQKHPGFFDGEALALDLSAIGEAAEHFDWHGLVEMFHGYGLSLIGVVNATPAVAATFRSVGLAAWTLNTRDGAKRSAGPKTAAPAEPVSEAPPPPPAAAVAPAAPISSSTRVIDKPVRSGQRIYAEGGDLVVLADVNPGGELIADGSIHVYGALRGKALAGARGDTSARVFCTDFDAELVSVAGVYRVFEPGMAGKLAGRAAQVKLTSGSRGDQVVIEPL